MLFIFNFNLAAQACDPDVTSPNITCQFGTFGLTTQASLNYIIADNLGSSFDSCTAEPTLQIARMADSLIFSDTLWLTCEDALVNPILVLRSTDASGNENMCMDTFEVTDKLAPIILNALPDLTVSCSYPINIANLSGFGTYVDQSAARDTNIIEDSLALLDYPEGFLDGTYAEICEATVTTRIVDSRECNSGVILRIFTLTDPFNNSTIDTQRITIESIDPFNSSDIIFPADTFLLNYLGVSPSPDVTGKPIFSTTNACQMPAASFKDVVFDDPNSGCPKIERTWKVIDWCQNSTNPRPSWEHRQYIMIKNSEAPVFDSTACENQIICFGDGCEGIVSLSAIATDDKTLPGNILYGYTIRDTSGLVISSGQGNTYTDTLEGGIYDVVWTAADRCGNVGTCAYQIQVKDCSAPTPIAVSGLITSLMQSGMVWADAAKFNNSSVDNCTPDNLLIFSFSPDTDSTRRAFTCADLGENVVEMWVTDADGNQSFVETFLTIEDNQLACPNAISDDPVRIAGRVTTDEQTAISNARVRISGPELSKEVITTEEGKFAFEDLAMYNDYEITVEKMDEALEGLTALDIVLIQRHILGITKFKSPYKMIAADLNLSESVNASDIVLLRKLILGILQPTELKRPWIFVENAQSIPNPAHPWPLNEQIQYENLDVDMMGSDYIAVKVGDIDGTINQIYGQNTDSRSINVWNINIENKALNEGEIMEIPFFSDMTFDLNALQAGFEYDPRKIEILEIIPGKVDMKDDEYVIGDNSVKMIFTPDAKVSIHENEVLFSFKVRARSAVSTSSILALNSEVMSSIAYNGSDELLYMQSGISGNERPLEVFQNSPNPFTDRTEIQFSVSQDMPVEVTVYDLSGAQVWHSYRSYNKGVHTITFTDQELLSRTGLFLVHVESAEITEIRKMLRIK